MEIRAGRRFRTQQEIREIVEETLRPGASVSVVARAHDVNANQVFRWRKLNREGKLEIGHSGATLLPVKVGDVAVEKMGPASRQKSETKGNGVIDIDLGHARVRIEGAADLDCVRAVLEGLVR